jgi:hypothetical protein
LLVKLKGRMSRGWFLRLLESSFVLRRWLSHRKFCISSIPGNSGFY